MNPIRVGFIGFDSAWQWHDDGFRWLLPPASWTTITWNLSAPGDYEEVGLELRPESARRTSAPSKSIREREILPASSMDRLSNETARQLPELRRAHPPYSQQAEVAVLGLAVADVLPFLKAHLLGGKTPREGRSAILRHA